MNNDIISQKSITTTISAKLGTYCIITFGCQMNSYDSDKMKQLIENVGYKPVDTYHGADLVILNTCNIREKAAEKLYSDLGKIRIEKNKIMAEEGRKSTIVVAGCVAQAEGDEIFNRNEAVDIVIGPEAYHNLPYLLQRLRNGENHLSSLEFEADKKFDYLQEELKIQQPSSPAAFLTIQEGCDQFCSYCVVPYTRGPEFSRPIEQIITDANKLVEHGAKEIVLLGQNVNAFHGKDNKGRSCNLAELILKLAENKDLHRIRYTTSHPKDMSDTLIAAHACEPKLMPLLNLPVQSGSNRVLKLMNRNYTHEQYLETIQKLRKARHDIIFSSDFIVGFPTETEEDFEQTLALVKEINFGGQCFSFKYSPRPGTPSVNQEQIAEEIKSERLQRLQTLLEEQRQAFNGTMLGAETEVLFDKKDMRYEGQLGGRTPFLQIAIINNLTPYQKERLYGTICKVKITEVNPNSLSVELID